MSESFVNAFVDGDQVVLLRRDENGQQKSKRVPAQYTTFLLAKEIDESTERMLRGSAFVRALAREGDWIRVQWLGDVARRDVCSGRVEYDPQTREKRVLPSPLMALGIRIFEGDVDPVRRFMTDSGSGVQAPRRCFLDIEADSRVSFSEKESARILGWAIYDMNGHVASAMLDDDTDAAEKALLEAMWKALTPFDQVLAWNLDGYDGPMITARSDRLRIHIDPRYWLWLDHLVLFRRMNMHAAESGDEKQSMSLQNISMSVLGEGKEITPPDVIAAFGNKPLGALSWELWAAGGKYRQLLHEYMCKDTDLLRRIEVKTGFAGLFDAVAEVCRVFPNSYGLNPTVQVDGFLLRLGLEQGHHFPTKQYREEIEQYAGAYVMAPKCRGVARDVHVGDFASLYPSIILTWNMSPETKVRAPINGPIPVGCCRCPTTGIVFQTGKQGILVTALRGMMDLRKFWNDKKATFPPQTPEWVAADRRSTAYKVVGLGFYGVVGSPFSRFFDSEIGESITQNGVWLIKQTIAAAEERGMRVIYTDTDSIFVEGASRTSFEEFVTWCNKELYPTLLKRQGCVENHIKMAYEKQFDRIVFVSAKRYAGRFVHYKGKAADPTSKPEIKGLEFKRGDTALLARRLQEKVILQVLGGDESRANYEEVLDDALRYVLEEKLPVEEVKLTKALTKPIKQYVTRVKNDGSAGAELPHVHVAKILKERGREVSSGTRIDYIVTDGGTTPQVVLPAEDYDGKNADRFYLWEDLVWKPSQRFLEAAFPDWSWKKWDRVRPSKKMEKARAAGQLEFVLNPREPFMIHITEREHDVLDQLLEVLRRHPGNRPIVMHAVLNNGSIAKIASRSIFVTGSSEMVEELNEWRNQLTAALDEWAVFVANGREVN